MSHINIFREDDSIYELYAEGVSIALAKDSPQACSLAIGEEHFNIVVVDGEISILSLGEGY